jgi:hypothetical protein
MMKPRQPIEVARLIAAGRWKEEHVLSFRTQFGERALLDVLLCPFTADCSAEHLSSYDCQQAAGTLLLELKPPCDVSLRETIYRSLSVWNLSVEQWPFYLCRCFGIDVVTATIDEIAENETLNDVERRAVETLRYWLRTRPDTILGIPAP